MGDTFVKTAGYGDNLPGEAAALRWLAAAEPAGGIRIVRVLDVTRDQLVEERVATGSPSAAAARRTGAHARGRGFLVWVRPGRLGGRPLVRACPDAVRGARGCRIELG